MKATILRRRIFNTAGAAQRECRHAGLWPVIRQGACDGIAGAAMRAGNESIPPASAHWVKQLIQAIRAHGNIGANGRGRLAPNTAHNRKPGPLVSDHFTHFYRIDPRQWRCLGAEALQQFDKLGLGALGSNLNTQCIIAHPTSELELLRQPPDKGPETDTLNNAGDADSTPNKSQRGARCNCVSSCAIRAFKLSTDSCFAALA